jgi:hypothetical protein
VFLCNVIVSQIHFYVGICDFELNLILRSMFELLGHSPVFKGDQRQKMVALSRFINMCSVVMDRVRY